MGLVYLIFDDVHLAHTADFVGSDFLFVLLFKAIIGMFFQDGLTGSAWGDWSLYTASPLRAGRESKLARNFFGGESTSYASFDPAKELGVQDPIGFWDPLGLSADKDEATFKRRRAVEIKHGRIVRVQVVLKQSIRSHCNRASCLICMNEKTYSQMSVHVDNFDKCGY